MVQESPTYSEEQSTMLHEYTPPPNRLSPMMPALSASSSASTSAATRRRLLKSSNFQTSAKSPADIELATEIGQGLLSEVRKLQSLLQQTEDALAALELEKADNQQEIDTLKKQLKQRSDSQDHYKEEIWNLELAKQELIQQVQELTQSLQRSHAEQARLARQEAMLTHEIDQLRAAQEAYKESLEKLQQSHEQDLLAMKKSFAKADRDRRSRRQAARANVASARPACANELTRSSDAIESDSETLPTTPQDEETGQPKEEQQFMASSAAAQRANQKKDLEVETLQSSLVHAHNVMQQLEQSLASERRERAEVDKLLREAQETIEHGKQNAAWSASPALQSESPPLLSDEPLVMKSARSLGEELVMAKSKSLKDELHTPEWPSSDLPAISHTPPSITSSMSKLSMSEATHDEDEVQPAFHQENEKQEANVQYGSMLTTGSYIYHSERAQDDKKRLPLVETQRVSMKLEPTLSTAEKESSAMSALARTMVGDWLWKYTRKVVGNGLSEHRHKRFFWIHPYTRMLCWSKQEPGLKGSEQTKSVMIESFAVIGDTQEEKNGKETPRLIIQTPTRNVVIQCPGEEVFQTWVMSLNYLYNIHQAARESGAVNRQTMTSFHSTRFTQLLKSNPPQSVRDFGAATWTNGAVSRNLTLTNEH